MTLRNMLLGGALFAFAVTLHQPASAQNADVQALMERIQRLERDIRTLNVQVARGGGGGGTAAAVDGGAGASEPAVARLNTRISQLENDLRGITGRLEEMSFQINQVSTQLEKMTADVDFRLKQLEQGGRAPSAMAPSQPSAPMGQQTAQFGQAPAQPAQPSTPDAGAVLGGGNQGVPSGSQVLGTLNESDLQATGQAPAGGAAQPQSEADALLQQLTGGGEITGATPQGQPIAAPAPAPQAAPAPGGVNVDAQQASQQAAAPTETAALPDGTPRDQYMYAFGLLRQGKYDVAAQALRNFLEKHGDDKLASNARYWLGETYYVRGAFVDAAETFLEGYQADPQGPKAPDALLKLGMSLSSLDKKQEACAAFQKLRADYPDASAGLKSTLQREWQKNGCV